MTHDKRLTSEDAKAIRNDAAQASIERDLAVYTAVRASGREAAAIAGAKEQQSDASIELAQAIDERDVARDAEMQATGREAVAEKNAVDLHAEALHAQASATLASAREAVAVDDAREKHVETLSAQADAAHMNTLRHLANVRANDEARGGDRARFMLYLLTGTILVAVIVIAALLLFGQ